MGAETVKKSLKMPIGSLSGDFETIYVWWRSYLATVGGVYFGGDPDFGAGLVLVANFSAPRTGGEYVSCGLWQAA